MRGMDLSGLKDPEAVAREVLWAHTLGASLAAGWADYGRIAPGARADLTLWEGKRPVGRVYRGNLEIFRGRLRYTAPHVRGPGLAPRGPPPLYGGTPGGQGRPGLRPAPPQPPPAL